MSDDMGTTEKAEAALPQVLDAIKFNDRTFFAVQLFYAQGFTLGYLVLFSACGDDSIHVLLRSNTEKGGEF